jgi:hypothetical protein
MIVISSDNAIFSRDSFSSVHLCLLFISNASRESDLTANKYFKGRDLQATSR